MRKTFLFCIIIALGMLLIALEPVNVVENNTNYISRDFSFYVEGAKEYVLISKPKVDRPVNGYPVIIIIHGYIPMKSYSTYNSYSSVFKNYANSEFIVVKPDLMGHGRSEKSQGFSDIIMEFYFVKDILKLVDELGRDPDVDKDNIFLLGHSMGGNTAMRLLVKEQYMFRAAILWGPVVVDNASRHYFYREGGLASLGLNALKNPESKYGIESVKNKVLSELKRVEENPEEYAFLDKLDLIETPILIKHADTDQIVPYYWSEELVQKFKEIGKGRYIELKNYSGDNHNLSNSWPQLYLDDLKWFRSKLEK